MSGEIPTDDLNRLADAPVPWRVVDAGTLFKFFTMLKSASASRVEGILEDARGALGEDPYAWAQFKHSVRLKLPDLVPASWGTPKDDDEELIESMNRHYDRAESEAAE